MSKAFKNKIKLNDYVSVTDFGAVGDGVTDDYAAIAAAIAALPSAGGEIFFPTGKYLHNTALTITKNVTFTGCGHSIVSGVVGPTEIIKGAGITTTGLTLIADGITIQHLNYRGAAGNTGDGIVLSGGRQNLKDVGVYGAGQDNVRIGTDAGVNANLWRIDNLYSKNAGRHGLHLSDKTAPTGADCNGGTLTHADLQNNFQDGLHIVNSQLNTFIGVVSQTNGARGITLSGSGCNYNHFYGGDVESCGADEVHVETGATGNVLVGMTITGSFSDFGTATTVLGIRGAANVTGLKIGNVAASDPKVLDWYEEGTFTPVLTFVTPGDLNVVYAANGQIGRFTRIGNKVFANVTIETSTFTHTTASGAVKITGLPYASGGITGESMKGSCIYQGYTAAANPVLVPSIAAGTDYIQFRGSGSGVAIINPAVANFPTGGSVALDLSIAYTV